MSCSLVPGLNTMIIFCSFARAVRNHGNKKTAARLRDGLVSMFPASTHSPQTGLAKIKREPRLLCGDVLINCLHFHRKTNKIACFCQPRFGSVSTRPK